VVVSVTGAVSETPVPRCVPLSTARRYRPCRWSVRPAPMSSPGWIFTHHFSGPGRLAGPTGLCGSVIVCAIACERDDFRPRYMVNNNTTPHNSFTAFFRDHPGDPVPEENFWTLRCKGRLTEAETPTIQLGATPFGLTIPITVKWAQWDKTQSRQLLGLFVCVCIALCTIVAHSTAQNRPDNVRSYPPDNHHCCDNVYMMEEGFNTKWNTRWNSQ